MKILMFGRGTIATIYGWALEQAGHDVEFYVRPGRAAAYGNAIDLDISDLRHGIRAQQIRQRWPVRYRESLESNHDFDLIVLSVGHHYLPEAAQFLASRLGHATVLVFGNIWAEPRDAVGGLPADRLVWGFPQAGGGFGEDGVLRGGLLPSVILGTLDGNVSERGHEVRRMFRGAGFRIREERDFTGWLWIHFVADAGMHSQGLKAGSLSKLVGSARGFREALLTTREILPLLTKRGIDLSKHRRSMLLYRVPTRLSSTLFAWATTHLHALSRSLEAHTDPDAEEPRAVCRDTLTEARRLGVPTPRLEAMEPRFAPTTPTGSVAAESA